MAADNGSAMSEKKVPLIGRLAVQLKLIGTEQLYVALREQVRGSQKRLGTIMLEKGFINESQLAKLQAVQNDLIAKHKAQRAASQQQPPAPQARPEPGSPNAQDPRREASAAPTRPPPPPAARTV